MKVEGMHIAGTGAYLPPSMPAERAVELGLYDRQAWQASGWTGAAVAGDMPAPEMAVLAARRALACSGHRTDEIDALFHAYGFHQGAVIWPPQHYVQQRTIGGQAPAFAVYQACNGMLGAMELAVGHLQGAGRTAVLITGADNFGVPTIDRWSYASGPFKTNRGTILGDGGAALVLSRRPGVAELLALNSASLPDLEEMYRGDLPLFPPEASLGRQIHVGARIAEYAAREPRKLTEAKNRLARMRTVLGERTLADAGVEPGQITRVTHVFCGGPEYVRSVLGPLGIDPDKGMLELGRDLGHLGTADHVLSLDHLLRTGQVGPGDHVLMASNGASFVTCALFKITAVLGEHDTHEGK
ncbi:ketoacyl-ACP synthase III family protein [Streptomyces sp. NPDC093808]|uniref:ketoacyl-ACP synthase III family protein n=1 Tax=Streptomyces sp. NPDC093808 TaxID=3154985 RepID=UPI00344CBACA